MRAGSLRAFKSWGACFVVVEMRAGRQLRLLNSGGDVFCGSGKACGPAARACLRAGWACFCCSGRRAVWQPALA